MNSLGSSAPIARYRYPTEPRCVARSRACWVHRGDRLQVTEWSEAPRARKRAVPAYASVADQAVMRSRSLLLPSTQACWRRQAGSARASCRRERTPSPRTSPATCATSPVRALTAMWSLRQSLFFGGSRRLPTWIFSPVLSTRMWTGLLPAAEQIGSFPSFLALLDIVVWSGARQFGTCPATCPRSPATQASRTSTARSMRSSSAVDYATRGPDAAGARSRRR